ncbi:MAG: DUF4364 family protein [Clostridia bacterium]|nr:DUF4364 family protein [Clostridia bacterium]
MEYTYKPTEYEIKLIILYTIRSLKVSSNYTMLDYVISSATNVNYFELEQYIAALIDKDNIVEYEADGNKYFSITESGEETLEFFAHKIPGSIMNRLEDKIHSINRKETSGNKFYADYFPINENEYTVKFSMEEGGTVLMKFELYAGPKERAIAICSYLKNNTADFYKSITELIDKGTDQ